MSFGLVARNFSRASQTYLAHAKLQQEVGNRLLQRFDYLKINPARILDLGAGPGVFTRALAQRFPHASVIATDISSAMLGNIRRRWRYNPLKVTADMAFLPFSANAFDVIFANQVLHWGVFGAPLFQELHRTLAPGGVLLFSTLGPDTFEQLKNAWAQVDNYSHLHHFHDMHLWGDLLLKTRYQEPVVDMEKITVRYQSLKQLVKDLRYQGVQLSPDKTNKGLVTPARWKAFEAAYEHYRDQDGLLPLTYEVIYGQAWGGREVVKAKHNNDEVAIPLARLVRKKKLADV